MNSRHKIIGGLVCKRCGAIFSARKQRVDAGLGLFCSRKCSSLWKAEQTDKKYVGKENGKISFDKKKNSYYVYWFDPDTLERKTTSYARWYWEFHHGEIPDGYRASYKDNNGMNINPENIILVSPDEFGKKMSDLLMGHFVDEETKKKISVAHTGLEVWNGFTKGEKYIGFSKKIKLMVKERDEYKCKICRYDLHKSSKSRIHHIDGNKKNSSIDNLVLVCSDCHSLIHSKQIVNEQLLAFRSALKS